MNFLNKVRIVFLKIFTGLNLVSLLFWMCAIDAIISWQPYAIMGFNLLWLFLMAYANGWMYETKPYYERMERRK